MPRLFFKFKQNKVGDDQGSLLACGSVATYVLTPASLNVCTITRQSVKYQVHQAPS